MKRNAIILLAAFASFLALPAARAGSATWSGDPITGDWNTAANWMPNTVPNSSTDSATLSFSNLTGVTISSSVEVSALVFPSGANAYTVTTLPNTALTIDGTISNSSGVAQTFVAQADASGGGLFQILGTNGNTGVSTTFLLEGGQGNGTQGGAISIIGGSALNSTFLNGGGTVSGALGGAVSFFDVAVLDEATIISEGGQVSGAAGGLTTFYSNEDAEKATLIANGGDEEGAGGAVTLFMGSARAGAATLIANGGTNGGTGGLIEFHASATGGTASVEVFGNGNLDIGSHSGGVTIGSLEGDGLVFLGAQNLSVGSSALSTTYSGIMQDGGISGKKGGAVTKLGSGTLTLSGASTYTGGTTVTAGTLTVSNKSGSATGTGAVTVTGGILGGSGTLSGAVSVNSGAFLAPATGGNKQAVLTILSSLTLQADATYTYTYKAKSNKARSDEVVANGVTINSGASIALSGKVQGKLHRGLVLTVLSNTSANPIAGTFSNLPDGASLSAGSNTVQASYEGGDGNDLTLTVQ